MHIIGITGVARSGKDTLAEYLVANHGYKRVAFADSIREVVSHLTGLTVAELTDGPLKEEPIEWMGGKSPRQLMQTLGTEWGREMVDPNLWLNIAANRIREARRQGFAGVVIPDVRFDNEAEFVRERLGSVVRVVRPGAAAVSAHESEQGVSENLVDSTVINDGTRRDLAVAAFNLSGN